MSPMPPMPPLISPIPAAVLREIEDDFANWLRAELQQARGSPSGSEEGGEVVEALGIGKEGEEQVEEPLVPVLDGDAGVVFEKPVWDAERRVWKACLRSEQGDLRQWMVWEGKNWKKGKKGEKGLLEEWRALEADSGEKDADPNNSSFPLYPPFLEKSYLLVEYLLTSHIRTYESAQTRTKTGGSRTSYGKGRRSGQQQERQRLWDQIVVEMPAPHSQIFQLPRISNHILVGTRPKEGAENCRYSLSF
jgi:hypothetical protein